VDLSAQPQAQVQITASIFVRNVLKLACLFYQLLQIGE